MREFAAALVALPSVAARTICGAANTAPAAVSEDFKNRRRVECDGFFMALTHDENPPPPVQVRICHMESLPPGSHNPHRRPPAMADASKHWI
jgi:hypothetical protein